MNLVNKHGILFRGNNANLKLKTKYSGTYFWYGWRNWTVQDIT